MRIGLWGVALAAIGFAGSFLIPSVYKASAVILPPEEDELTASLSLSRRALSGLGAFGRFGSYFTQADVAMAILKSRSIREEVAREHDLVNVYDVETLQEAGEELGEKVNVKIGTEGTISVTVEDEDADRAAELANAFITQLDRYNSEFRSFSARRTRIFLETRVAEADSALNAAGTALAEYQQEHGSLLVPQEAAGALDAVASLMAQKLAAEVELEVLRGYASPQSEEVQRLERRVWELRRQVGSLPADPTRRIRAPA